MIPNELLEKIAIAVSGIAKDSMKAGFSYLTDAVKNQIRKYVLTDEEQQALTKILDKLPDEAAKSEETIVQYLKEQLKSQSHNTVNQVHYGTGDNVGRDKNVR